MTLWPDDWDRFEREMGRCGAAGRTATLWWRDADATSPSPQLDALLARSLAFVARLVARVGAHSAARWLAAGEVFAAAAAA